MVSNIHIKNKKGRNPLFCLSILIRVSLIGIWLQRNCRSLARIWNTEIPLSDLLFHYRKDKILMHQQQNTDSFTTRVINNFKDILQSKCHSPIYHPDHGLNWIGKTMIPSNSILDLIKCPFLEPSLIMQDSLFSWNALIWDFVSSHVRQNPVDSIRL